MNRKRFTSVSRPFVLLLGIAFSLVVTFSIRLTYMYRGLAERGTELTKNIRATSSLNQQLRNGISEQVSLVRQQFDSFDASFPEEFIEADDAIGQKQIEYLRLDIGKQERLTVEKIRSLHSELGVEGFHVFEFQRSGNSAQAKAQMEGVESLQKRIQEGFEELHNVQMEKLQSIHRELDSSVSSAFLNIYGLTGSLILALALFMALLRRRVVAPVKSIHRAANRVRDGDFSARVSVHQADEVGEVANAFNFMAESLAQNYADLEHKVDERTREVQQLQQKVVQAAKMSAVGQMISGVAHELNNPLTVIMGYAELNKAKLSAKRGDVEQIKLFDELLFQADRCRKIVANLLQFARKVEPEFEFIWINELIEKVLQLREYEFNTRNVNLVREYDPGNPVLSADKNKLQQVLLNLTNNAYDAIRETDRAGIVWIRTRTLDDRVIIEITDNGTGIDAPNRVFEPFYTTKDVGKGTGLGLSVCYGIVEEHQGEIKAENWEHGARFTVSLPVGKRKDSNSASTTETQAPPAGGYRALIVDDERPIVELQKSFLKSIDVEAFGVNSGEEAIRFLESTDVDVVLSDIRMPGSIDGLHLFKWIEQNRKHLTDRFIFLTGDSVGLSSGELLSPKSIPHVAKPFNLDEYSRVLKQVLENKKSI
jgi:signal transduction histidine kinase/ActR/RegA family two-component response regulator